MTLVGTALNLGEKSLNLAFYVVVLQMTAKKWTKVKSARARHAKLLFFFCPLNMQICDVFVAVPYYCFARFRRSRRHRSLNT